jgi:hypothetical protein
MHGKLLQGTVKPRHQFRGDIAGTKGDIGSVVFPSAPLRPAEFVTRIFVSMPRVGSTSSQDPRILSRRAARANRARRELDAGSEFGAAAAVLAHEGRV